MLELLDVAVQPARAFAARRALPTALVLIEVGDALREADRADALFEDGQAARAEHGARLLHVLEVERDVDLGAEQRRAARSAGDVALHLLGAAHAAGVVLDQLARGDAHGQLPQARALDVARDAPDLETAVLFAAQVREGLPAILDNPRDVGDRLDVVHDRRAVEQADGRRERRLIPRLAGLALERLDERHLLAADVRARAGVNVNLAVEAAAEDVLADEALRAGLFDGALDVLDALEQLTANVDVADLGLDRVAGDQAALDERVRVALHDEAVLERARLALVCVDAQVDGLVGVLGQEAPLDARGEARAAAAAQVGRFDLFLDLFGGQALTQRLAERAVAAVALVAGQRVQLGVFEVRGQDLQARAHAAPPSVARLRSASIRASAEATVCPSW